MNVFEERGIITLDLHGVRHHEVNEIVHDFVLRNQDKLPLIIICHERGPWMLQVSVPVSLLLDTQVIGSRAEQT